MDFFWYLFVSLLDVKSQSQMVKFLHSNEMEDEKKIYITIVGRERLIRAEFAKYQKDVNIQKEWQMLFIAHNTPSYTDVNL